MKIDMDISNNYFNCFDESRGIVINRNRVLKNKSSKVLSYMKTKALVFLMLFGVSLVLMIFSFFISKLFIIFIFMFIVSFVYIIFGLLESYFSYRYRRSKNFFKSIIINEEGIINANYYDIKMIFGWDKINAVVIGTYSITILTTTPYYFTFSIDVKEKLISSLVEYGYENKIIF